MHKLILAFVLAVLCVLSSRAQTNLTDLAPTNAPGWSWLQLATTDSQDWTFALYPSYAPGLKDDDGNAEEWGFGFAAVHGLGSDFVKAGIRTDYLGGNFFMGQATIQLQAPLKLFGKLDATPFAVSGIGTPLAGAGEENYSFVTVVGGGLSVRVFKWKRGDLCIGAEAEKWYGLTGDPWVYHGGIVAHFSFK